MAGDDPSSTDPVTAAFAKVAAAARATTPLEVQSHPSATQPGRLLITGLIVLAMLLALAVSTYALLNL